MGAGQDTPVGVHPDQGALLGGQPRGPRSRFPGDRRTETDSPVTRDTALRASQPVAMGNPRN